MPDYASGGGPGGLKRGGGGGRQVGYERLHVPVGLVLVGVAVPRRVFVRIRHLPA